MKTDGPSTDGPSTHETFDREEDVRGPTERSFGITFAVVFGLIGLLPLLGGHGPLLWALAVAVLFLAAALARPALLRPLNLLWLRFGLLLHRIVSPVVLGVIFFLVLTPTAWFMRRLGKDVLNLRFDRSAPTYWTRRQPRGPDSVTMRQQF